MLISSDQLSIGSQLLDIVPFCEEIYLEKYKAISGGWI